MTCEEFEATGLGVDRDTSLSEAQRVAAREHAASCSRCAALEDSWQRARLELRSLAEETADLEAPARVEMRLRQEFHARHHTVKAGRTALIAAWALAAAAVLVGTVSWINWRSTHHDAAQNRSNAPQTAGNVQGNSAAAVPNQQPPEQDSAANSETLVAGNELSDFTLLPGVLAADTDDAAIFRVRMQRGGLGALGLPVNEDRAGEWIQVDLLVGNDGLPQAVRLPQSQ
jgi:anti-sigma factor RsiW